MFDRFFEQLTVRTATIDELLSDAFKQLPGQKADTDIAGRRLAAWCRSSASGDWALFAKRLARDGLTMERIMPRLATVGVNPKYPPPPWIADAKWIGSALRTVAPLEWVEKVRSSGKPQPFEDLFLGLVFKAELRRNERLSPCVLGRLAHEAHSDLAQALLSQITELCAHAIYERFLAFRQKVTKSHEPRNIYSASGKNTSHYNLFINEMRNQGFRELLEATPVLLRLISTLARQWMDTSTEFLSRLDADIDTVHERLLDQTGNSLVIKVDTGLSDLHNFGRSVYVLHFADGCAVVYKPKDLRVDAQWRDLVSWLNERNPPVDLRAARVLTREGYGWAEFIHHKECAKRSEVERFFERAGAWLALFHVFVATDMHEENMIAEGEHPVPIDLEMILQPHEAGSETGAPAMRALEIANRKISESVMMTGLLPAFSRTPETKVIALGGLNNRETQEVEEIWIEMNTDEMALTTLQKPCPKSYNLPKLKDRRVSLGDVRDYLISGFGSYGRFLSENKQFIMDSGFVEAFSGLPIRRALKPTRFYFMLLSRLKDYAHMSDGAEWSAHLDFIARLSDWDKPSERLWALFAAERKALCELNIPFFVCPADGDQVRDSSGIIAESGDQSGLSRSRSRITSLNDGEVDWQSEVVRLSTITVSRSESSRSLDQTHPEAVVPEEAPPLSEAVLIERSSHIARYFSELAVREDESAAWIGLDWLGDSEACQLAPLGFDLYNGTPGIAIFLASHSLLTRDSRSRKLALAALAALRHNLRSSGAARFARGMGIGGAAGLGSVVYALTVASKFLDDAKLMADARYTAGLFTDDLITADASFDVIGGAAGGILGLLKLYRESHDPLVLARAIRCGEHLLNHRLQDPDGPGLWRNMGTRTLTGFSHGAAGFAYALSSLSAFTGRDDFALAAQDCLNYERSLFSAERGNWPDLRSLGTDDTASSWLCQWCHGASGIGLTRIGMQRFGMIEIDELAPEINAAVLEVQQSWPSAVDTLCCGNLGNIELLREAAHALDRHELRDQAARRLSGIVSAADSSGDFRWGVGENRYNLGFFRGLAGVGYTLLRQIDPEPLPNVLIWE